MKWLARIFAHAVARRVAFVLVALLFAALGVGQARAQTCSYPNKTFSTNVTHADRAAAYAACVADAAGGPYNIGGYAREFVQCKRAHATANYYQTEWRILHLNGNCANTGNVGMLGTFANYYWTAGTECPAGSTWNETTKTCFNGAQCLAKNDTLGSMISVYKGSTNGCEGGCAMSMGTQYTRELLTVNGNQVTMFAGKMRYTGAACSSEAPAKKPDDKAECQDIEGTSTCKKSNGEICHETSTGRFICWKPGETGEKTDGPDKQRRDPGQTPQAPSQPISGDTLVPNGPPITTTTTTIDNSGQRITNTTTNSYTTTNGTNAGTGNDGAPTPDAPGEGEGDGEGNGVGGTGDCQAGWLATGDPHTSGILTELNKLRCKGDSDQTKNAADVSSLNAAGDALESEFGENVFGVGEGGTTLNQGLYGGSGTCPDLTIDLGQYGSASPPPAFCTLGQAIALLFQLAALVWGMRIVME